VDFGKLKLLDKIFGFAQIRHVTPLSHFPEILMEKLPRLQCPQSWPK